MGGRSHLTETRLVMLLNGSAEGQGPSLSQSLCRMAEDADKNLNAILTSHYR